MRLHHVLHAEGNGSTGNAVSRSISALAYDAYQDGRRGAIVAVVIELVATG
jgi:hypothetical protein